jgi:uncharacterized repeat protein (TIGR01451 family)
MVVIIYQTWWHVEDIYYPSQARIIRQVMNLITNDPHVEIELFHPKFVGLKAIARNLGNKEIAFLVKDDKNTSSGSSRNYEQSITSIILLLGELTSFPNISMELQQKITEVKLTSHNVKGLKFVKLEISYTNTDPKIIVFSNALKLQKSASPSSYNVAGQNITYTYTVTNSGNSDIIGNITVTDDILGQISILNKNIEPGQRVTGTSTYKITQADFNNGSITNSAHATNKNLSSYEVTATVGRQKEESNLQEKLKKVFTYYKAVKIKLDKLIPKMPRKSVIIELPGMIQPELYITVPVGWRIDGNAYMCKIIANTIFPAISCKICVRKLNSCSTNLSRCIGTKQIERLNPIWERINDSLLKMIDYIKSILTKYISKLNNADEGSSIAMDYLDPIDNKRVRVYFNAPIILMDEGKRKYHYLIHETSNKEILELIEKLNHENKIKGSDGKFGFTFTYTACMCHGVMAMSLVPFLFLCLSGLIIFYKFLIIFGDPYPISFLSSIFKQGNSTFPITYIACVLTFSIFEYNLRKEVIEIPFKYWHIFILIVILVSIVSIILH